MSDQQPITSLEAHPASVKADREDPTLESGPSVSNTPTLTDAPVSKGLSASSSNEQSEGVVTAQAEEEVAVAGGSPKDVKFWLIIVGLLLATFLAALDLTSISTALPTIAESLRSENYAWIANSYSITSTAIVPWAGGMANIFGRRAIMLVGLVSFFIGSAMCGAAQNIDVMITGRSFQGIGSGIILTVSEIILADLVSLSERGAFQGAFGAIWSLASAVGPPIGGAFASTNWRWLFYMNLPLSAIIMVVIGAFVHLKVPEGTMRSKLARMDWFGNLVFIPAITLFIVGLLSGGQPYPWTSAQVLAPLIIGIVGLFLWFLIERYYAEHPTVPFELLLNGTSFIGYFTTFVHGIMALTLFYYWPVYFQAVKGASPVQSAVDFFSVAFVTAPFAMIAGGSISALQKYKAQNVIAWVFMSIGPGLMTLVHANAPKAFWVGIPIPFAVGTGLLYAATVFPVLAPLPPSLAGTALAFLVFVRNLGNVLGITIGSTVLANELSQRLPSSYLATIPGGVAGAYSAIPLIAGLNEPLRTEVRVAFAESIRVIWIVLIPFGIIGLGASVFMKHYQLDTVTDEQWGMDHVPARDVEKNLSSEEKAPSTA